MSDVAARMIPLRAATTLLLYCLDTIPLIYIDFRQEIGHTKDVWSWTYHSTRASCSHALSYRFSRGHGAIPFHSCLLPLIDLLGAGQACSGSLLLFLS